MRSSEVRMFQYGLVKSGPSQSTVVKQCMGQVCLRKVNFL